MQSFRRIGLKLWKIQAIQNRYPIVVYGVMSDRESKNPRPLPARKPRLLNSISQVYSAYLQKFLHRE